MELSAILPLLRVHGQMFVDVCPEKVGWVYINPDTMFSLFCALRKQNFNYSRVIHLLTAVGLDFNSPPLTRKPS